MVSARPGADYVAPGKNSLLSGAIILVYIVKPTEQFFCLGNSKTTTYIRSQSADLGTGG
jgi:hypothetical protein